MTLQAHCSHLSFGRPNVLFLKRDISYAGKRVNVERAGEGGEQDDIVAR